MPHHAKSAAKAAEAFDEWDDNGAAEEEVDRRLQMDVDIMVVRAGAVVAAAGGVGGKLGWG